jgi:predicted transcriptional regulator
MARSYPGSLWRRRRLSDKGMVYRTYDELRNESYEVYRSIRAFLRTKHHDNTMLSVIMASLAVALEFWKTIQSDSENDKEKKYSEQAINNFIECVYQIRSKTPGLDEGEKVE